MRVRWHIFPLLLLLVQTSQGELISGMEEEVHTFLPAPCPNSCVCMTGGGDLPPMCVCSTVTSLTITCKEMKDEVSFVNQTEELIRAIGAGNITQLTVTGSPLMKLTPLMCQMTNLVSLRLVSNKISEIRQGCFSNMSTLNTISLSDNRMVALKSGIFDGLKNLRTVNVDRNDISHIDPDVFVDNNTLLKFPYLTTIGLESNMLTGLDTWPFLLAQKAQHRIEVNFDDNKMTVNRTTNFWNVNYTCGQTPPFSLELSLKTNKFDHYSLFLEKLGFKNELDILCMFSYTGTRTSIDVRYNELICDCLEYEVFKFIKAASSHSRTISGMKCSHPPRLQGKYVTGVSLPELVCPLTNSNGSDSCPSPCLCEQRPDDPSIIVNCANSQRELTNLPYVLPQPITIPYMSPKLKDTYRYILDFEENGLVEIDSRHYFNVTKIANFSTNIISNVTIEAWEGLLSTEAIYLHNNSLEYLDPQVANLTFDNVKSLSLHRNLWACDCHAV